MAKAAMKSRLRTVHAPAGAILSALMLAIACIFVPRFTTPDGVLAQHFAVKCPPDAEPPVTYTGHTGIDRKLCGPVTFFQTLHSGQEQLIFSIHVLTSLIGIYNIWLIEASRSGRSLWVAFPVVWGMLGQYLAGAFFCPIYLIAFFLSGAASNKSSLIQTQAESILVGLLVGFCIPTVVMYARLDDYTMAIWQNFPLWVSIVQQIYLFLRPTPKVVRKSGYLTVQLTLFISFLTAAIVHLIIVGPLLMHPIQLLSSIISYFPPTNPTATDAVNATYEFLKWDCVIFYACFLLAGLPFTNSLAELGVAIVSLTIGSIVLGPGAAIAAMWMWKEMKYEEERHGKVSKSE